MGWTLTGPGMVGVGPSGLCVSRMRRGGREPWWLGLHSTHVLMGKLFVIWELADSRRDSPQVCRAPKMLEHC